MIKKYNNKNYNCKLMVIRKRPYKDSYIMGQFIIDYFVVNEYNRILELREEINTNDKRTIFIDYVEQIPRKKDYTKDELVLYIKG